MKLIKHEDLEYNKAICKPYLSCPITLRVHIFPGIWFRRLVNCKKYVREAHMQSKKGSSNMTFNAAKYFCINLSVHVQYREIEHLF